MIEINQQLCKELDLTYWQLNSTSVQEEQPSYVISREENELLRKILLTKGIALSDGNTVIHDEGVVTVNSKTHQLIFNDVTKQDTNKVIHLSKLADMLNSVDQKKQTWHKLKNLSI